MTPEELQPELERLHADSFGWALACCRWDRAEAEETLQATYLKVLEGKARFEGRSSLRTWLYSVIRRTAAERRRRDLFGLSALASLFDPEPRAGPSTAEHLEQSERQRRLLGALEQLPQRQREVLDLVFYRELTLEQAAEVMGVSVGTARVHYDRGKKRLHQLLGGWVHEFA